MEAKSLLTLPHSYVHFVTLIITHSKLWHLDSHVFAFQAPGALLLGDVIRHSPPDIDLLSCKDLTLLARRIAFFVLSLGVNIVDIQYPASPWAWSFIQSMVSLAPMSKIGLGLAGQLLREQSATVFSWSLPCSLLPG